MNEEEVIHITKKEFDERIKQAKRLGYADGYDDGYDDGYYEAESGL